MLAAEITNTPADFSNLDPMVAAALGELERAGVVERPQVALADAQYWNEQHMDEVIANKHIQVLIPPDSGGRRSPGRAGSAGGTRGCEPSWPAHGKELYRKRMQMIEPVFAHTKHNRLITRFHRRGRTAVRTEWRLLMATHNLTKPKRKPDLSRREHECNPARAARARHVQAGRRTLPAASPRTPPLRRIRLRQLVGAYGRVTPEAITSGAWLLSWNTNSAAVVALTLWAIAQAASRRRMLRSTPLLARDGTSELRDPTAMKAQAGRKDRNAAGEGGLARPMVAACPDAMEVSEGGVAGTSSVNAWAVGCTCCSAEVRHVAALGCVSSPPGVSVAALSLLLEPPADGDERGGGHARRRCRPRGRRRAVKLRLTQAHQMCRFLRGPHPAVARWWTSLRASGPRPFGLTGGHGAHERGTGWNAGRSASIGRAWPGRRRRPRARARRIS